MNVAALKLKLKLLTQKPYVFYALAAILGVVLLVLVVMLLFRSTTGSVADVPPSTSTVSPTTDPDRVNVAAGEELTACTPKSITRNGNVYKWGDSCGMLGQCDTNSICQLQAGTQTYACTPNVSCAQRNGVSVVGSTQKLCNIEVNLSAIPDSVASSANGGTYSVSVQFKNESTNKQQIAYTSAWFACAFNDEIFCPFNPENNGGTGPKKPANNKSANADEPGTLKLEPGETKVVLVTALQPLGACGSYQTDLLIDSVTVVNPDATLGAICEVPDTSPFHGPHGGRFWYKSACTTPTPTTVLPTTIPTTPPGPTVEPTPGLPTIAPTATPVPILITQLPTTGDGDTGKVLGIASTAILILGVVLFGVTMR